jgi:hypothetical protein
VSSRPVPAIAAWLLKVSGSGPKHESVTGDLLEQYQFGRGRFWYWKQVLIIVLLGVYGHIVRRPLVPTGRARIRPGVALILFIAVFAAVLLSDIWILLVIAIICGVFAGILIFGLRNDRSESMKSGALHVDSIPVDAAPYHPGISLSHIPVEGAVGLLFVLATGLIFGIGVPAIRQILLVTVPLGIIGSAVLIYWHKHHPRDIQPLDLHDEKKK